MKKIDHSTLKVTSTIKLKERSTHIDLELSKEDLKDQLKEVRKELGDWQDILYAHQKYSVLVCLQGNGYRWKG